MITLQPDHSVSSTSERGNILLIIYVEAIIIIGDEGIENFLQSSFQTKDLGKLHYFLGIEVAWSKEGISLSQRNDMLDILGETGLLDSKPIDLWIPI